MENKNKQTKDEFELALELHDPGSREADESASAESPYFLHLVSKPKQNFGG